MPQYLERRNSEIASGIQITSREVIDSVASVEFPGIFIFGHARTGTSILMDALNSASAIFMFGEANFHESHERRDFRQWFNLMHQEFKNLRGKGTYCPALLGEEASGWEYIHHMRGSFDLVGDKIAFRGEELGYNFQRFFDFHTRHFFKSFHICTMRHPYLTLKSNFSMFGAADRTMYVRSYIRTALQIIEMYQIMPKVLIVVHHMVDRTTFEILSERLNINVRQGIKFYGNNHEIFPEDDWHLPEVTKDENEMLRLTWNGLLELYDSSSLRLIEGGCVNAYQRQLMAFCKELAAPVLADEARKPKRPKSSVDR